MNTHTAEGGYQIKRETAQATAHQRMPTHGIQIIPDIQGAEKWGQESHSDPVEDGGKSMPGASLGRNRHKTEFVTRFVRQHNCEHSVGVKPKDNYNVPNDNQITEVSHTLFRRGVYWVLSQRSVYPLTLILFFHGTLHTNIILGNNHEHWDMIQKCLRPVHPDSSQQP